ncbi:MAG: hypothetical protein NDF52_04175 [archaeon YNP-WB-062]|jgi:hypothetical protein|nr:hypothetical protein [Candidatus Culexarchaeum yellowstonense]
MRKWFTEVKSSRAEDYEGVVRGHGFVTSKIVGQCVTFNSVS